MVTFSIIIPVRPGGDAAALESLRRLDETSDTFEILIAEGCSPSRQRNSAAEQARGDVLYFLDDDSQVDPNCLKTCSALLGDETVAVVGGPSLTPGSDTRLQRLFGVALASIFGAGGSRNRYRAVGDTRTTNDSELILCNLAIRRATYLNEGGLDERLYPNEENELLDRIQKSGHKLLHAPRMAVLRSQRTTLRLFVRQMFSYGRGRGQQTLIAGTGTVAAFIPLIFLLYLAILPLTASVPFVSVPLYAYCALDLLFTVIALFSSRSPYSVFLIALFPLMHITNGFGLLGGLLGGKGGSSGKAGLQTVTTIRKKEFGQADW